MSDGRDEPRTDVSPSPEAEPVIDVGSPSSGVDEDDRDPQSRRLEADRGRVEADDVGAPYDVDELPDWLDPVLTVDLLRSRPDPRVRVTDHLSRPGSDEIGERGYDLGESPEGLGSDPTVPMPAQSQNRSRTGLSEPLSRSGFSEFR